MSRLKQLGKDSLIYGIGGILAKGVSFFLLPVYTRIFTPADYGTIEMLTVVSSFLASILVMGMDSAQSMYFFKHKDEGKSSQARIVTSILQWRLVWGSAIVIIATVSGPMLNATLFNGKLSWEYFAIAFAGTLFAQIMSQSAEVMRLIYRPWGYIGIILSQSLLSAALILTAVLVFDQGIFGFFLGTAVASMVVGLVGCFRIREYLTFDSLHVAWWPQLFRFGAPLVPATLALYFMNTADRWFVQYYHGEEALGLFAVGAKFAMLMTLAVDTFRKAWWPIAMDAMHSGDGPETFRMIARMYMGVGTALIIILTVLSPWLIRWIAAPAYHDAWPISIILAWQALFYGGFLIASAGIWKAEKTYLNLYLMGSSAILGVLLNWLLVPNFGGIGAALSTSLTYFLWTVASLYVSERCWHVGFKLGLHLTQMGIGIAISVISVVGDINKGVFLPIPGMALIILIFSALDMKQWQLLINKLKRRVNS